MPDAPLPPPGLYYPLADFPDEEWLKLALLNWDQLQRIRPSGFGREDRPATSTVLRTEPEAIVDLHPDDDELWEVGQRFIDLLIHSTSRLQDRYGLRQLSNWPIAEFGDTPSGGDPRLAYIFAYSHGGFAGKMLDNLPSLLETCQLGAPIDDDGGIWLGMHPRLASVYMCALTEAIAARRLLAPVTDNMRAHHATGRSTLDRLEQTLTSRTDSAIEPTSDEVRSHYIQVALAATLKPLNLKEVPIERVIEFRQTHQRERRAFQAHIDELQADFVQLASIPNRDEVERRLERIYRLRTAPQLADLQDKLNNFGIKSIPGVLKLKIDTQSASQTLVGLGTIAVGHIAGVATAGVLPLAIAMAAIPYAISKHRDFTHTRRDSSVSFLLAARTELVD